MASFAEFIERIDEDQKEIVLYFHELFVEQLGLIEKIRYKIPFYYRKSWICYLNPIVKSGVELAFVRGNELSNAQNILDSQSRRQVYGIRILRTADIPVDLIMEIVQEALILDESIPYASKRKVAKNRSREVKKNKNKH